MKKTLCLVLALLLAIAITGCSESVPTYYGTWTVDSLLPDAPMGNFSEEDTDKIYNASLTFSAEQSSCFGDAVDSLGQTVSSPEYIEAEIPKADFESMTGVSFESLGISGSKIVQVSVVNDPSYNNGIVFYVVDDSTLLSNSLGTFFVLKKS